MSKKVLLCKLSISTEIRWEISPALSPWALARRRKLSSKIYKIIKPICWTCTKTVTTPRWGEWWRAWAWGWRCTRHGQRSRSFKGCWDSIGEKATLINISKDVMSDGHGSSVDIIHVITQPVLSLISHVIKVFLYSSITKGISKATKAVITEMCSTKLFTGFWLSSESRVSSNIFVGLVFFFELVILIVKLI